MRIGSKVKLSLFVVAVGITICATLASHSVSRRVLIEALSDHLGTTARSRANHIETLLEGYKSRIALVAKDHRIQACLRAAAKQGREEGPAGQELNGVLREFTDETREFLSVLVLDRQGTVVGSSDQRSGAMDMSDSQCFLQGSHALYVEDAFRDEGAGVGVLAIAAPVTEQEKLLGVVVARIAMNGLNKITSARTGLGKTGEIYVVNRDGYMVTRSRFVKDSFLKQTVDTEITREHFAEVDASSEEAHLYTAATYPSYMGRRVFGLHAHINAMPWCLCAEISEKEALGPLAAIRTLALVILCGASLVAWAIGSMVSRFLTGPIEELQRGVQELGRGHLECRVGTVAADEIGDLSRAFDEMADNLRTTMTSVETLNNEVERRKQTEESLRVARDQAEAATAAKSEFLANMSHEIRTPMNAIMGFTQILRADADDAEQIEFLGIVEDCCNKLLKLINDILDLSKIEVGKVDINVDEFPLQTLLRATESLLRPLAEEKMLDLEMQTSETVPELICSDSDRLHQCLVNLVGNAIKFTEKGHVHVNVSATEEEGKSFIRFDVEDTGPGIPPDKRESIFEAFTQANGSTTRVHGGTGLGLALVKHVAELLGGYVTLTSTEGVGSVFSLAVPLLDWDGQSERRNCKDNVSSGSRGSVSDPRAPANISFKVPSRILVVEDNYTNQELMRILLEKMGHEVVLAGDGIAAVEKAATDAIDLIFMDMQMPKMRGYDATRAIKEKDLDVPVIALTAYAMKGDREKCIEAGCDDYMSKPIDYGTLVTILNKYLPAAAEDQRTEAEKASVG